MYVTSIVAYNNSCNLFVIDGMQEYLSILAANWFAITSHMPTKTTIETMLILLASLHILYMGYFPVIPVHLARPGIDQNLSCAVDDFTTRYLIRVTCASGFQDMHTYSY